MPRQPLPQDKRSLLQSVRIKNFRGFDDLNVLALERINLFTGKNNTGKTSLLEALFIQIVPNNPELLIRANSFRGIERYDIDPEEIWGGFFYGREFDQPIEITSQATTGKQQSMTIRLVFSGTVRISAKREAQSNTDQTSAQTKRDLLTIDYRTFSGSRGTSRAILADGDLTFQRGNLNHQKSGVFLSTRRFPQEDAARFSRLERIGREVEVTEILKRLEPRLKRLSVLVAGGLPFIHGDIGLGTLIPIPMMGEGVGRLLSIVLAILQNEDGIILIDEIENGFHYSVLSDVWCALAETARKANAQIIATSHSWECVRSAHQSFTSDEIYDFRLHRLERHEERVDVITYDQEQIDTSLEMNFEVR